MEILLLMLLTLLNGLFAMSEMAIVSSRKARLQHLADEGWRGARSALALAESPSDFLATVQVGITVIGVASGALGGAALASGLSAWLAQWPAVQQHADAMSFAIVITGITVSSVVLGELVPKRLALLDPEAVASRVSGPMGLLATIASPLVRSLSALTDGVLSLLRLRARDSPPVTEDEIRVLMEQGAEAGIFEPHEPQLVDRVFRLSDLRVAAIMTPRASITYLDIDDPPDAMVARIVGSTHTHFPVIRETFRDVRGFVKAKALLDDALAGKPFSLANLAPPLFVPPTGSVMDVVALFRESRQTAALVVNTHGDTVGLVTLNDVMEALARDVATVDLDEPDIVKRADGSWLVDAGMTVERFKDLLQITDAMPEEGEGTYHTLAGFSMLRLGRVPTTGECFEWGGLRFEVVDMDGNRLDKLLVTRLPDEPEEQEGAG